jgi:hypothetical protein
MKSDSSQRNKNGSQRVPSASADSRWDIHADVIQRIQRRIDTNNHDHPKAGKAADSAQVWQNMSMDRIAVILTELTSNASAVIDQFNRNPRSLDVDSFIEYVEASAERVARLADQISEFADFGKSNGRTADRTEMSGGGLEQWERKKS